MNLECKVVLITGAGRPNGIGAGIAKCFADEGAHVVVTDLSDQHFAEIQAQVSEETMCLVADAADQREMQLTVNQIVERFGRLDVLVNNAGIGGDTMAFGDDENDNASAFMRLTEEAWDQNFEANLKTTFASTHAAIPALTDGGSIINIASMAALQPARRLPAYGAAKAAVVHLTKTLSMELAPRRIRVNCICPGLLYTRAWEILTERMKRTQPEFATLTNREIFNAVVREETPLGGEQTPQDVGNLAVFYASDKARMITGQVVAVDGGISVS